MVHSVNKNITQASFGHFLCFLLSGTNGCVRVFHSINFHINYKCNFRIAYPSLVLL